MRSEIHLADWRGDVSVFSGQLHTIPEYMDQCMPAAALAGVVCPNLPFVTADKALAPYALPCTLREALLLGKTLEKAKARGLPLFGYMRSASHITEGRWIKLDLDGIGKDDTRALLEKLDGENLGYLLYSTWSHGAKPRNRLRLVLFLDVALSSAEYKRASQGAALWLMGQSLDPSEGGLHQLAGVFMCHPDRQARAFRLLEIGRDRHCLQSDALLTLVPEPIKTRSARATPYPPVGISKIGDALRWIDANEMGTWVRVGMALRALAPELGEDAIGHWLAFSDSAEESAKKNNEADDRYNPETMWESFAPAMPADAAKGQLLALGRDGAADAAKQALKSGELGAIGHEAMVYLEKNHSHFLKSLLADAGFGGV